MAGGLGGAVTPVPFPNTDVKGPRGDGTTPRSVGEQRAAGLLSGPPASFQRPGAFFLSRPGRGPGVPMRAIRAFGAAQGPRVSMRHFPC